MSIYNVVCVYCLEAQTSQEVKTDSEAEKQAKYELNPNAQEFRPRVKRNTPSPVSTTTYKTFTLEWFSTV